MSTSTTRMPVGQRGKARKRKASAAGIDFQITSRQSEPVAEPRRAWNICTLFGRVRMTRVWRKTRRVYKRKSTDGLGAPAVPATRTPRARPRGRGLANSRRATLRAALLGRRAARIQTGKAAPALGRRP